MTDLIKAVDAAAASSGRGLDAVLAPLHAATSLSDENPAEHDAAHGSDADRVRQAVDALSEQLAGHDVALNYRVDPELHRVIVEVVDQKDGSVLRQIPGEEAVRLARLMRSGQGGLLQATV